MDQETTLKGTFFGGFRKKDVMELVNSVLESNDQKVAELERRIAALTKTDSADKFGAEQPPQIVTSVQLQANAIAPVAENANSREWSVPVLMIANREELSIREQMNIPEGIYQVTDDQTLISLSENSELDELKPRIKADTTKDTQPRQLLHLAERKPAPQIPVERSFDGTAVRKEDVAENPVRETKPVPRPSIDDKQSAMRPNEENNGEYVGTVRHRESARLDTRVGEIGQLRRRD